jgi:hypothetical protein
MSCRSNFPSSTLVATEIFPVQTDEFASLFIVSIYELHMSDMTIMGINVSRIRRRHAREKF